MGLKFDLENCLDQLRETGEIQFFEIATRDVCDRFIIPENLYGRETEVQTLLNAFDRVSLGNTEFMLVAGFSGIGKTAVVNEVHKPIVRQWGGQHERPMDWALMLPTPQELIGYFFICQSVVVRYLGILNPEIVRI